MSIVLYPLIGTIAGFSFGLRFVFMGGLMFMYADFCSVVPLSTST
jgi:hypothetical protein